jgi:hypothetical protein
VEVVVVVVVVVGEGGGVRAVFIQTEHPSNP